MKKWQKDEDRFSALTDKRGPDECWPWLGEISKKGEGYGRFFKDGKKMPATHYAWELHHGKPFPGGLQACHSCDNPGCVNPKHIWPGTPKDNMHDCIKKGRRHIQAPRTHCKRGHEFTPENTIKIPLGRKCRACTQLRQREHYRAKIGAKS